MMNTEYKKSNKLLWLSILTIVILSVYLYQEARPTVIFHTYKDSGYLGKVVCTYNGKQDKLYIEEHIAIYRIPYTYNWNEDDEIAIFMRNYGDVLKKEDINFWRLDIFLDNQGRYKSHNKSKFLGIYPW